MSTLLKDIYSPSFYENFSHVLKEVLPSFDQLQFTEAIFDATWSQKELKDRMRHTSWVLHQFLPNDFEKATFSIREIILKLQQKNFTGTSVEFMFFPDYVETFGIEHYDASIRSIEFITQFISCEFAVRPFLIKYGDKMLMQMYEWSMHENHKVRRLASEGSRPRLPWAMALPQLKKDPLPNLALLENLKSDPSEWVRRSVANHLNDISKDHTSIVISLAQKWKGLGKETDAIIKHGCRTLLKQGHPEILAHYGLFNNDKVKLIDFDISTKKVTIGDDLIFSFSLHNQDLFKQTLRIEYSIYYLRQGGQFSKKVFKISERSLEPNEKISIEKRQSFKLITTRKFYHGPQQLSIIINGKERQTGDFELST
jgi:3-methyladenine DNA glycosylase AlkC